MSETQTRSKALGARENWWGESDVDDLRGTPVADLSPSECKRLIEADTDYNIPVDRMGDRERREYIRDMRCDDDQPQPCLSAYEVARWKAHDILRGVSEKHSRTAKHAPPFVTPISATIEPARLSTLSAWFWGGDADRIECSDRWAMHRERCDVELTEPELHIGKLYDGGHFGTFEYGQYRHRKRFDPEHGYIGGVVLDDLGTEAFLEVVEIVLVNAQAEKSFRDARIEEWFDLAMELKRNQDQSDQDVLTEVLRRIYLRAND